MNIKKKRVSIIGGGASGTLCAILIKKLCDCEVIIYELQSRILKKVLQTGNGMCNLTNEALNNIEDNIDKYNTYKIKDILKKFDLDKCKDVFSSLGLLLRKDNEGRYYPYSRKATSVSDVLCRAIEKENIKIICNKCIDSIDYSSNFTLYSGNDIFHSDYVIVSCGGISSINFKYSSFYMLENLGHHITPLSPSLVGFRVKESIKSLSGIRVKGNVRLIVGEDSKNEYGEIQFKDDGLSGIAIMELSRFYNKNKKCKLSIDLMSDYKKDDIYNIINNYIVGTNSLEDALCGIFPKMIAYDLVVRCKSNINYLVDIIKDYTFNIISTYDFNNSQVTKGGISLEDVNLNNLESLKKKDLYIIGEMLDVDGTCGGYNLHFAWASADLVSKDIAKKINNEERVL